MPIIPENILSQARIVAVHRKAQCEAMLAADGEVTGHWRDELYRAEQLIAALEAIQDQPRPLPVPTIHSNGTTRGALIIQATRVARVLSDAAATVLEATPHDRDFYPQGTLAGEAARVEWRAVARWLEQQSDRFQNLALAIHDQGV